MESYELPDDGTFRVINFSGGRSSAFMLYHILEANNGEIPEDRAMICFANTGKERPETLRFVNDCERNWGVQIDWIEFDYDKDAKPKRRYRLVDFETCSRKGEPFVKLIDSSDILPNAVMRKCTADLKVNVIRQHMKAKLGKTRNARNVIGFRADETRRVAKAFNDPKGCTLDFPMYWKGVLEQDVNDFWKRQNFDLQLPNTDYGNCDLCFLKGKGKLVSLLRQDPSLANWWIEQESKVRKKTLDWKKIEMANFNKSWSYEELKLIATETTDMFADDVESVDCFCGD